MAYPTTARLGAFARDVRAAAWAAGFGILALSACAAPAVSEVERLIITETQNGQTIAVRTGMTMTLQLPVQLGTGYNWQLPATLPDFLALQSDTTQPGPGLAGATQLREIGFLVKAPGTATLEFAYRQPWLPHQTPAKIFKIEIVAR